MRVVDLLVVEDEECEAVHPGFDARNGFRSGPLTQVDASTSPEKVGVSRIGTVNLVDLGPLAPADRGE